MSFRRSFCLTLALCFVVCGALLPANVYAKSARTTGAAQSRQTVTGTVVSISGRTAGRTRQFTLRVNNYTSASDAERLNNALRSGGQVLRLVIDPARASHWSDPAPSAQRSPRCCTPPATQ